MDPTPDAEPPGHVTCGACWVANPPLIPVDRMTDTCTLSCPKLRLRSVMNTFDELLFSMFIFTSGDSRDLFEGCAHVAAVFLHDIDYAQCD